MRRGELNGGDQQRQRAGLPQRAEDVEALLGGVPGRLDAGVADGQDEEDDEAEEERRAQVLVARAVPGDGDGEEEDGEQVGELADGDAPGVGFPAEAQDHLRRDGVDGRVEDPAFDGEGEDGEGEVGARAEEDVGDEAVGAGFPFCGGG